MVWKVSALIVLASLAVVVSASGAPSAPASSSATTAVAVAAGKPSEFRFTLSKKKVTRGTVVFRVTNRGTIRHDFKITTKTTRLVAPGQSTTLRIAFKKAGKYRYLCTVPSHAAAGMKGVLVVT
jgi:uncharacterized cupredoxin-like copper-binding protein